MWSSASEAVSSSVPLYGLSLAFDDFNGDCWPSGSDDESPDLSGSSSSSISALPSETSESERVARKMCLEMAVDAVQRPNTTPTMCTLFGHCALESSCCVKFFGEYSSIHPLIIVIGEPKATRTGLHCPPSYFEKRKVYKHQSCAKRCILRAPRHKTPSLIIAGPSKDQTGSER